MVPAAASDSPRGFTLIELMAVMAILGTALMLLPANLDGFGDRTKLDSAGNTMVAVLTGAREQAVIDGHDVILQIEIGNVRDRKKTGRWRSLVAQKTHEKPKEFDKNGGSSTGKSASQTESEAEDEWVETLWRGLPDGVILTGYSSERGVWKRESTRDDPISVTFSPDGSVRPAHAIRLESVDLDASVPRVLTIRVNALTSAAELVEGEQDLPATRDAHDFN